MSREAPPTFYKYYPVEEWLPKFFAGESLRFSSRTTFNDPFDSRPAFQILAKTEAGKKYIHSNLRRTNLSPAERVRAAARIRAQSQKARPFGHGDIQRVLDETGILSLTTTWENILMWSHYGQHHQGICVGFHSEIDVFATALPVEYRKELPVIYRPDDEGDDIIGKTFLTKAKDWEYEDEWRIIKRKLSTREQQAEREALGYLSSEEIRVLVDHRGRGDYQFHTSAIESVTLGMRIPKPDEEKVCAWIRESGLKIPVYKVNEPSTQYAITRMKLR
ncbi:MAG TPA: DUF2971 domain-containing protein [Noviherbaspirillum sp.]|nr:DUF2971 domain-containing protein [Noviherbaspirillum sp.]